MSKGKELIKNTGILFIGKVSTQFISFLLLPLYTAKLATSEYGSLDLYTSIANILIPLLSLQLEHAIFRFLLTKELDEKQVLSSTTLFLFLSSLLLVITYVPITQVFSIQFSGMVLLYYVTQLFSVVAQQILRGYEEHVGYALNAFLASVISIVLSAFLICGFEQGIEGILTAQIVSSLVTIGFVCYKVKLWNKIGFRFCSITCLRTMLQYSVPLVFNQLASWVINYSDRVIIVSVLGFGINGVYAIANKFFSLIISTLNIYNLAWTESVTKNLNDSDRNSYYNKVFSLTTMIFFIVSSFVIAGIGIGFEYFIDIKYDGSYFQIPILVYAAMFSGLSANVGSVYIAYKKTKEVSYTTIFTAIINIIVHIGLIKFVGLYAASISTFISFVVMFFYRLYKLREFERLYFPFRSLISQLPFVLLVLISYYMRIIWLQMVALVLLVIYALYYIIHEKTLYAQLKKGQRK